MYKLMQIDLVNHDCSNVSGVVIETYDTGEDAVRDILSLWHEDDTAVLFIVVENITDYIWATIARGTNPNDATVSRTDGASQRFRCMYETINGKTYCHVSSLS